MKNKPFYIIVLIFLLTQAGCTISPNNHDKRPNILIILADDLGYSDLGSYGGEIQTPNLDNLAENGIRFTQFYNSARCCPSRASLLTGLFPHQAGIGSFAGNDKGAPGYKGKLNDNAVTIAEVLRESGYQTFGAGKWHVNLPGPIERGFQEYYGFLEDYGVDGWESKWMKRYPEGRPERTYEKGTFFATNAITDYALDFLKMGDDKSEKPWFMYLAYQAPHFPLQAPAKDIAKYVDTYDIGWDSIRSQRLSRMKSIGVIDKHIDLSPRSEQIILSMAERDSVPGDGIHNPDWNLLDQDRKTDLARRMAVYAGMVDNMDQNIGRVLNYLKESGEFNNTLILFMSDNGSCGEWDAYGFEYPSYDARVAGGTPGHPNVLHKGENLNLLGSSDGPLFTYGSAWANAGNTPFSLYKMFVHEGGISSPLIIHWPQKIKDMKIFDDNYGHFVDVMSTVTAVAEAEYPEDYNGKKIQTMEGVNLFDIVEGNSSNDRILTFEHSGHPAIRQGDWKLVSRRRAMGKNGFLEDAEFELYNIRDDRSETTNLASNFPEKVKELKAKMMDEFERTKVFPKPG